MCKFKKGSVEALVYNDLEQLTKDRDYLLNELKKKYPNGKDLDSMVNTICIENAIIDELQSIINRTEKTKKEK